MCKNKSQIHTYYQLSIRKFRIKIMRLISYSENTVMVFIVIINVSSILILF